MAREAVDHRRRRRTSLRTEPTAGFDERNQSDARADERSPRHARGGRPNPGEFGFASLMTQRRIFDEDVTVLEAISPLSFTSVCTHGSDRADDQDPNRQGPGAGDDSRDRRAAWNVFVLAGATLSADRPSAARPPAPCSACAANACAIAARTSSSDSGATGACSSSDVTAGASWLSRRRWPLLRSRRSSAHESRCRHSFADSGARRHMRARLLAITIALASGALSSPRRRASPAADLAARIQSL